ncbi:MAG: glycosyltransferase family 2 protein, partial [Streptococcus vestibularis]|nr:glycosyltransferase family 2 protein [Streptococcus vestibularis]
MCIRDRNNIYIAQLMLFNWLLMIGLYLLQINVALASQFGQATSKQIWLAILSYFSYAQLFIIVSLDSLWSIIMDKILHREGTTWVKTKRFAE